MQETANQRLKFLIDSLGMSVRAFSSAIEVPDSNTRNYLDKGTKLNIEYLEKIARRFNSINISWLITGDGVPFTGEEGTLNQTNVSGNSNNVASGKGGKAIQKNYTIDECTRERDDYREKLEAARREIELLTGQVKMQATIIEGKDQMLDLLKGGFNRPN